MLQVALEDPGISAGTWRGVAAEVLASNAEQESLIEALLALASSQGGLGERELVDLAAITGEILLSARPEAARQGLSLDAVTRPAPLLRDKLLAERLVANLVGNAVRHNVAGGKVEISTAARDGRAVLAVANTGPAIPPEAAGCSSPSGGSTDQAEMGTSHESSHTVRPSPGAGAQHVRATAGILAALSESDRALLHESAVRILTRETPPHGRARSCRRPVEHVRAGACLDSSPLPASCPSSSPTPSFSMRPAGLVWTVIPAAASAESTAPSVLA